MEQQIDYAERAALLKALAHPLRLQLLHGLPLTLRNEVLKNETQF